MWLRIKSLRKQVSVGHGRVVLESRSVTCRRLGRSLRHVQRRRHCCERNFLACCVARCRRSLRLGSHRPAAAVHSLVTSARDAV